MQKSTFAPAIDSGLSTFFPPTFLSHPDQVTKEREKTMESFLRGNKNLGKKTSRKKRDTRKCYWASEAGVTRLARKKSVRSKKKGEKTFLNRIFGYRLS